MGGLGTPCLVQLCPQLKYGGLYYCLDWVLPGEGCEAGDLCALILLRNKVPGNRSKSQGE